MTCLLYTSGTLLGTYWEEISPSHGRFTMRNFSESPKDCLLYTSIKAIYYQFAADEDSLKADWLTYEELDKPAMRKEYFGNIYATAEDNAGNRCV